MFERIKYLIGSFIFGLIFKLNVGSFESEYNYMINSLNSGITFDTIEPIFSFLFTILILGISLFYFIGLGYLSLFPGYEESGLIYFSSDTNDIYLKMSIKEKRISNIYIYIYTFLGVVVLFIFLLIPLSIVFVILNKFPVFFVFIFSPVVFISILYVEFLILKNLFFGGENPYIFEFEEMENAAKYNKRYIRAAKKALKDMEKGTFSFLKYY